MGSVRSAVEQRAEEETGLNVEQDPTVYSRAARRIEMQVYCVLNMRIFFSI